MKLDNQIAKSIIITTQEPLAIGDIIFKSLHNVEIEIEKSIKVQDKNIFLTKQVADAFVKSKFAKFDYEIDAEKQKPVIEKAEVETPQEPEQSTKTSKKKQDESANKVDEQK